MENPTEVRDFLTARRAEITPDRVGLSGGSNRRVLGLRRSEVAMLADVSVEYYARLERGNLAGVSDAVLSSIADALLLDDAEREYLYDLAKAANASSIRRPRRSPRQFVVRPTLQHALDALVGAPAFVRNGRMDILAINELGRAMYSDLYESPERPVNLARFAFLDRARSERFYPDWNAAADICVAILRTEAGRDPHDRSLQDLIGELSTRSEDFRSKWAKQNVRWHATGDKHFTHPVVGELLLAFEAMDLTADPGLNLLIYTAEPGSPSADALHLLASWAATQNQTTPSLEEKHADRTAKAHDQESA